MKIPVNEGKVDRAVRVSIGVVGLLLIATGVVSGWIAAVVGVVSAISIVTAATGFCGLYALFGIDTCKVKSKE